MTKEPPRSPPNKSLDVILALLRARHGLTPPSLPDPAVHEFMAMLRLAGRHGVAAALPGGLRHIASAGAAWAELMPFLEAAERETTERNAEVLASAARIARLLHRDDIPAVFLKGTALLLDDADAVGWRGVTDIDLLVPRDAVEKAARALIADGFRKGPDTASFEAGLHHHYPQLHDDASEIFAELHVRLMQDERRDLLTPELIFDHATSVELAGARFLVPSPTHRLVHLIAHAQLSDWGYTLRALRLRDLEEACSLAARHDIDWKFARDCFTRIGAEAEFLGFVVATRELLDLAWPYGETGDQGARTWAQQAIAALSSPPGRWQTASRIVWRYAREAARNPRRLRVAWASVRDPSRLTDFMQINRARFGAPDEEGD